MNSDRFLRLRQVEDKIGFGKSWIYRQIQLQQFPPSIRLNSRHVAWPYDASRDDGLSDTDGGGYPTCRDWWTDGDAGLKIGC